MNPVRLLIAGAILFTALLLVRCHGTDATKNAAIPGDSISIAQGKVLFDQKCSGCHNFLQDGIGPNLAGVTLRDSVKWLRKFIQSPAALLDAGAVALWANTGDAIASKDNASARIMDFPLVIPADFRRPPTRPNT